MRLGWLLPQSYRYEMNYGYLESEAVWLAVMLFAERVAPQFTDAG